MPFLRRSRRNSSKCWGIKKPALMGTVWTVMSPEATAKKGQSLLSKAEAGLTYRVFSVYERDRKLLEFLEERGIRPGTHLKVESRNYDGTSILKVEGKRIALGSPAAEKIWVGRRTLTECY